MSHSESLQACEKIAPSKSGIKHLGNLIDNIGAVRFTSPFRFSSKAEVVREALRLGVPVGRTYSCQAASDFPCGACPNCVDRLDALQDARLTYTDTKVG
ncbi:hypothetical protein HFN62_23730 [Rhizobium leguminosarum]|nr:hypothetical protein [Rhizobium leguminosarum]